MIPPNAPPEFNSDERLARLSDELPGFAGTYTDGAGRLVVRLTDPGRLQQYLPRLMESDREMARGLPAELNREVVDRYGSARGEVADFDFRRLYDAKLGVVRALAGVSGVTSLDVSEVRNRVVVGAIDPASVARIAGVLAGRGVDLEAIVLEEVEPAIVDAGSLQAAHIPRLGGLQIGYLNVVCTLGHSVARSLGGVLQTEYFVTNSHCTNAFGQSTGMSMGQPNGATPIGTEVVDPPLFTSTTDPNCPAQRQCRYSDAALFSYNQGISYDHGKVAWPNLGGSLQFSTTMPINVTYGASVYGHTVQKVGRTTGRTSGNVTNICEDTPQYTLINGVPVDTGRTMLCQVRGNYQSLGGDSGSPVVRQFGSYLIAHGVHWGSGGLFSPMDPMINELESQIGSGFLCVHVGCASFVPTPLSVEIDGPSVIWSGLPCSWVGDTSGGDGTPLSYEWRKDGVLVETNSFYVDEFYSDFQLSVTVYDDTYSDTDYLWVDVDQSGQC